MLKNHEHLNGILCVEFIRMHDIYKDYTSRLISICIAKAALFSLKKKATIKNAHIKSNQIMTHITEQNSNMKRTHNETVVCTLPKANEMITRISKGFCAYENPNSQIQSQRRS